MQITMSSARPDPIELVTSVQRQRCWKPEQKMASGKQTNKLGRSGSLDVRKYGLKAVQLFHWCKAYFEGSLVAVAWKVQLG
jgi:hypothetical protein